MLKPVLTPDAIDHVIRLLDSTRRTWEADVVRLLMNRRNALEEQVRIFQKQLAEKYKCRRCNHQN